MNGSEVRRYHANYLNDVAFEKERQKTLEAACRFQFPEYDSFKFDINNDNKALQQLGYDCGFVSEEGQIICAIDVKERRANCIEYWNRDTDGNPIPEIWIDLLSNPNSGDPGWMYGSKKITDVVLTRWTDRPEDSHAAKYQSLRFGLHFCPDLIKRHMRNHDDNSKIGKLAAAIPIPIYREIERRHHLSIYKETNCPSGIPPWLDGMGPDVEWKCD